MKRLRTLLLVPVVLALCAGTAAAKAPPKRAGLDPSFGRKGVAKTATATATAELTGADLAVTPEGRSYVLQGMTVLAFEPDGKPAQDFGAKGRVTLAVAGGEGWPTAIAVDSEGRILVVGGVGPAEAGKQESFVIRLLPNGGRDPQFGSDGEVDTGFGIPAGEPGRGPSWQQLSAGATTITVDAQDRPIVGGRARGIPQECAYGVNNRPVPFVARLTTSGAVDTSFGAGAGYVLGAQGTTEATALAPAGELVVLTNRSIQCGEHENRITVETGRLTEAGLPSPVLDPARPIFQMDPRLAVDQRGRSIVVQTEEFSEQPGVVVRLLASGDVDTTFGFDGGATLAGRLQYPEALAVDAKGRPIIAYGTEARIELLRLRTDGKVDQRFGPRGIVKCEVGGDESSSLAGMALDARGRIYVLSTVKNSTLKTGYGVQVARFLPGS